MEGEFARKLNGLEADQERMNELGNNVLDQYEIEWTDPYRFKHDSFLVTSIYLGNNGKWASTTDTVDDRSLIYNSHNIDTARETVAIQQLFGRWVKTADALLEGDR